MTDGGADRGISLLFDVFVVHHAERLFGDPDYLVRVATADLAAYQVLRDEKLGTRNPAAQLDDRDETRRR